MSAGMPPTSGRALREAVLGVLLAALALLAAAPVSGQLSLPSAAPPQAAAPTTEEPSTDPYGRETPRGTLLGFLRACQRGNLKNAAAYLQTPAAFQGEREAIARELQVVFDRRFMTVNVEQLSRAPQGTLDDGLEPDTDRVGEIRGDEGLIDVLVVRQHRKDGGPIWLISWSTVKECRRLYVVLGLPDIDRWVPAFARGRLAGMALWQAIAVLALLPILYAVSWIAVGGIAGVARHLRRRAGALATGQWVASARSPATFLVTLVLHRVAVAWIGMPALYRIYYDRVLLVFALAGLLWLLARLIDNVNRRVLSRFAPAGAGAQYTTLTLARRAMKLAAFVFVLLLGLAAFGVNLTATLAGLGIGGLALAFAAQRTLGNLFGGVALLVENPIRVGEVCRVGGQLGEIEDVTLWSTRIRRYDRTVVSIPNGVIMESQIENLSRRDKFWFHPVVGLVYGTTAEQMRRVLEEARNLLAADPRVETEGARVRFKALSEFSLDVEIFAYVRAATYPEFLAVQEELLLRLLAIVEQAGTSVAFPSRTVYIAGGGAASPA
jgi:MscS family membrane protein